MSFRNYGLNVPLRQYLLELRIYLVVSGRRYQLEQILAQQLSSFMNQRFTLCTAMSMQMPSRFRRSMVSDVSFNSLSAFQLVSNVFILTVLVSCPSGLLPCAACIAFALVQVVESSYDVDVHEEEIVGDEKYLVFICFIER